MMLTVAKFARIPDPPSGHYELHHGELVLAPPPIFEHLNIQQKIMLILNRICIGWFVVMEFSFRPLPEHEVWIADVGMITQQRYRTAPRKAWLAGAPDLVIEILSPSNTMNEMNDRERTCFRGGCREFWVVDLDLRTIRVSTPGGHARTYNESDEIPLDQFVPAKLSVAEAFAE